MKTEQTIQMISIENIIPNRFQPRLTFDEQALNELSNSIKEHGIIQPILLRRLGDKYEIIAGERRYKAATMAGLTEVPAVVVDLNDNQSAEVALIENVQRRDLSSIEEAKSYKKILDNGTLTQEELAKRLGIAQSTIANKLRLLSLVPEVQEALMNEKISERHARSLLVLTNPEEQKKMLERIINERLTVRQLDNELKPPAQPPVEQLDITNSQTQAILTPQSIETLSLEAQEESTSNNLETLSPPGQLIEEVAIETLDLEDPKEEIQITDTSTKKKLFNIFEQSEYPSLEDETVNLNTGLDTDFNPFAKEEEEEETPVKQEESPPPPPEPIKRIEEGNLPSVTVAFNELEKEIKEAGFKVTSEEFDFEDLYQIIIKIDKTSS